MEALTQTAIAMQSHTRTNKMILDRKCTPGYVHVIDSGPKILPDDRTTNVEEWLKRQDDACETFEGEAHISENPGRLSTQESGMIQCFCLILGVSVMFCRCKFPAFWDCIVN